MQKQSRKLFLCEHQVIYSYYTIIILLYRARHIKPSSFLFQGALIGGITSLAGSLWLTFGSMMLKRSYPTFPPLSTDRCTMTNNLTYSNYKNTNSSSIKHFFDESPI